MKLIEDGILKIEIAKKIISLDQNRTENWKYIDTII